MLMLELVIAVDHTRHDRDPTNKMEMRWQRCPWLLVCVTVCLLLDYPICSQQQDESVTAIYVKNYSDPNHPDCNAYATLGVYFNNEAGKNITCPCLVESDSPTSSTDSHAHQSGALPPNSSVSWCYETSADHTSGIGKVTLCISATTGNRDVSYSIRNEPILVNHIKNINVLDDGQLHLPADSFSILLPYADINCTVFAEDGDQLSSCDIGFFALDREKTQDEIPTIESESTAMDGTELHFGERLKCCVSGGSLGVRDLQWEWSQDPHLETVNISASVSDPPCLNCECAQSAYYNAIVVQEHLQNKTVGGARGVAFSVLGYKFPAAQFARSWQCSGVPTNYLSFVIIDGVKHDDDLTELMFKVTSFTGDNNETNYSIRASYKQFSPEFHEDYFTQDPIQTPQQNYLYFCNASIPGDANLEWKTGSVLVQFISSNGFSSRSNLSLTDIDNLCQESSHNKTFAIRFDNSNLTDDSGALFHSQEIALVLCSDRRSQTPMTYTCYSTSDSSAEGPTASFPLPPSTSYHITATVVIIVIVVVIILLLII